MNSTAAARQCVIDTVNSQLASKGLKGHLISFGLFGGERYVQFSLFDHVFFLETKEETDDKPNRYYLTSSTLAYEFTNRANIIEYLVLANAAQFVDKKIITPMHKHTHYTRREDLPRKPVTITVASAGFTEENLHTHIVGVVLPESGKVIYAGNNVDVDAETHTIMGEVDTTGRVYYNGHTFDTIDFYYEDDEGQVHIALADDSDDVVSQHQEKDAVISSDDAVYEEHYTNCKICNKYNDEFTATAEFIHECLGYIIQ